MTVTHAGINQAQYSATGLIKHNHATTSRNKKFEKSSRDARKPIAFPVQ